MAAPFLSESKYCAKNLRDDVSLISYIQSLRILILEASSRSCPLIKFSVNPSLSIEDTVSLVANLSEIGKLIAVPIFLRL